MTEILSTWVLHSGKVRRGALDYAPRRRDLQSLWGIDDQRGGRYDAIKHVEHFRDRGVKNVFYFDTTEFGEFVAPVDEGELIRNQRELRSYQGELILFGKDGFYRHERPLWLEGYRDFGLPP